MKKELVVLLISIFSLGFVGAVVSHDASDIFFSDATSLQAKFDGGSFGKWMNGATSGEIYYSGGNVGVGTTDPGARLDVVGQVKISGGNPGAGKVLTSNAEGLATWEAPDEVTGGVTSITESGTTPLIFTGCDSGSCQIGMDVDGSGDCGVGSACIGGHTHDSRYYTESESNSRFVNAAGDTVTGAFKVDNSSLVVAEFTDSSGGFVGIGIGHDGGGIMFRDLGNEHAAIHYSGTYDRITITGDTRVYGDSDYGEVGVEIDGKVGIGTIHSTGSRLRIFTNEANVNGIYVTTTSGYGVYAESTYNNGVRAYSENGNGIYGESGSAAGISASGEIADFWASGPGQDYGSSSSIRWKNNVQQIDGALDKVKKMRGVYFDWDEEHGGKHDVGMIAEEVGLYLPEIVSYEEDGVFAKGLDYSKLTPLLVEAIKEQQNQIEELRGMLCEGNPQRDECVNF